MCGRFDDGTAACWDDTAFVAIEGVSDAVQIVGMGGSHAACVRRASGVVSCISSSSFGVSNAAPKDVASDAVDLALTAKWVVVRHGDGSLESIGADSHVISTPGPVEKLAGRTASARC